MFKIKPILAIQAILFLSACGIHDFEPDLIFPQQNEDEYQSEEAFCQSNPNSGIWLKLFNRDADGNITKETTFVNNLPDMEIASKYNNGQQVNDSAFYYVSGNRTLQYSHQYLYERNRITEIQRFEPNGTISHKTVYKYYSDKPRWEEFWYFSNNEWKFQYAHRFEFNRDGKLAKKESFQTEEKNKVYDTFLYAYKNGKLVEEKRIIRTGATSYVIKYTYNRDGTLDEKIQDGNVIEKNFYKNGKLSEKHTFYFGIDPGFSQCLGNFIFKYDYQ